MGRGSYLGGGTIIRADGWGFSRLDPLPPGKKKAKTDKPSVTPKKPKPTKAKANQVQVNHNWRGEYLCAVVSAEVREGTAPKLSKHAPVEFIDEVRRYSTPLLWAKSQPEYEKTHQRMLARAVKKKAPAAVVKKPPVERPMIDVPVEKDLVRRLHDLTDAIAFHERKLIELKTELVRLRKMRSK